MLRFALAMGLLLFGAGAAFMGLAVTVSALGTGEVTMISGPSGAAVTQSWSRATDPDAFWRTVALFGALPLVLGLAAVFTGRQMLPR